MNTTDNIVSSKFRISIRQKENKDDNNKHIQGIDDDIIEKTKRNVINFIFNKEMKDITY